MKKVFILLFTCLLVANLIAQDKSDSDRKSKLMDNGEINRSMAPKAAKAKEIEFGTPQNFTLENGLKVFVVENHKLPKVSFQLTIDSDPHNEYNKVGIGSLTGDMLSAGTKTKTKAELDAEIDFIGANCYTNSKGFYAASLSKHSDKILAIVSDMLLHPSFPKEEIEKKKKRLRSSLKSVKTNPDAILSRVSKVLKYGKEHPYGEIQTIEHVDNLNSESCREYYNSYFRPNISYMVIVGDINVNEAKTLVSKYFSTWEARNVKKETHNKPEKINGVRVAFVEKPGAVQSVISVLYPIEYKVGAENSHNVKVMSSIFGGAFSSYLNANLREDKAYTYGARGYVSDDKWVGSFRAGASVRNEVTDSSIAEILYEMRRIKNEDVSKEYLARIKNNLMGNFALSLEDPKTIARFALNIEKYNLNSDYYQNYLSKLQEVDIDGVKGAANEFIHPENCIILVVGNNDVAKTLEKFDSDGNIEYYDIDGNLLDKKVEIPLPEGLTAQDVINDYLMAITDKTSMKDVAKVYKKIKGISQEFSTTLEQGGQSITMVMRSKTKAPNLHKLEIEAMGMVVQKEVFNGKEGYSMNMQAGKSNLSDEDIKEYKSKYQIDKELKYKELSYELNLKSIEQIYNYTCYVIEVTSPEGKSSSHYFDIESKLKVIEMSTEFDPDGNPINNSQQFQDYKMVDKIMMPHKVIISSPQGDLEMNLKSLKINPKFTKEEFDL